MRIISDEYAVIEIENPVWIYYFTNAPATRQGEMVEAVIFRHLNDFTPFDGGFKSTFDGFDEAIDIDRDQTDAILDNRMLPNVVLYEDYMENYVFGEPRTDEVLVDIKYTSKTHFDNYFYGLTDLQKQFAATQHCRWIQCTAPVVSPVHVEIEYRILDSIPL